VTTNGVATRSDTVQGALRLRWPTILGIATAVAVTLNLSDGADLAPALAAMAVIYLAAAAVRRPSAAWPLFIGALTVILAIEALVGDRAATWAFIGLAVPLMAYTVSSRTTRADRTLRSQAIAVIGFGVVAAIALRPSDDVGAYLVAAGLAAHAVWDAYHHWANKAVVRSYAEFCCVLDALLAAAIVILTVWS
jgi:hypothetical protein